MMEDYLQTEWPDLEGLADLDHRAMGGDRAQRAERPQGDRAPLVEGSTSPPEPLPAHGSRRGSICGVPTRLFRVSFTGELGFEVNVPGPLRPGRVGEAIHEAGQAYGILAYGTETMHVLRAEKGYIIVGQDTDGTLTPDDAGLGWAIGKAKPDFVGKRSLARPDMLNPDRKHLVGLLTHDPKAVLEEGAQIVADPNQPMPMTMIGHVTSSYWRARSAGRSRWRSSRVAAQGRGETMHVPMPGGVHAATIGGTVFVDPEGKRLSAWRPDGVHVIQRQRWNASP